MSNENKSILALNEAQQTFLKKNDIDHSTWIALTSSVFPGAKPESVMLAIGYCKARNLDVLKKPVHIVPMSVKNAVTDKFEYRDVIMPGIYEHRTTACKTGEYAGQDAPIFGEMVTIKFGQTEHTVPESCTVTVYRLVKGVRVSFSHTEYFEEAAATKKDGDLNAMWTKRKRGQLSKCAEAGALRKAFPDELGGQLTAEEMHNQTSEIDMGSASRVLERLPEYDQAKFDKNLPIWTKQIEEGKRTHDEILIKIEQTGTATQEQKDLINKIGATENEDS